MRSKLAAVLVAIAAKAVTAHPALGAFPYGTGPEHKVGPGVTPNDLSGDDNEWKYSATPEAASPYTANSRELFGIRGGHVVDSNPLVPTAWQTTTGRSDADNTVLARQGVFVP